MDKKTKGNQKLCQRVIAFLDRDQVDFLDKVGKDALFSKGVKLSRAKIISCLVDLLTELEINGEGILSLDELKQRIKEKIAAAYPTTKDILIFSEKEKKQNHKEA